MKVYALVGASGTGKSHRALFVARQYDIQYLIDDGLLIHLNKIIAGSSAKREHTYIAAVKRAIFHFEDHRDEVISEIGRLKPNGILLIGTSVEMVDKIAKRLQIGDIERYIMIEEISSLNDINTARRMRQKHGKHVIPVPAVELKADFSGYFLDKLKVFGLRRGAGLEVAEKTVVRPTFSYLGRFTISNKAMSQIVAYYVHRCEAVQELLKIRFLERPDGLIIDLEVITTVGVIIPKELKQLMNDIQEGLEAMTQINVIHVDFYVKSAKEIKK